MKSTITYLGLAAIIMMGTYQVTLASEMSKQAEYKAKEELGSKAQEERTAKEAELKKEEAQERRLVCIRGGTGCILKIRKKPIKEQPKKQ